MEGLSLFIPRQTNGTNVLAGLSSRLMWPKSSLALRHATFHNDISRLPTRTYGRDFFVTTHGGIFESLRASSDSHK